MLTLRRLLQRLLIVAGTVVALTTFTTGTWWLLEHSLHAPYGNRPPQFVLVFGAYGSLLFGGLAFLIGRHMAITASSHGGVMVRFDPEQPDALVATTPASVVLMRGRPQRGWLHVSSADLRTDGQFTPWIETSTGYAPLATAQQLTGPA